MFLCNIYLIHINFFKVDVVFYSALIDSFIAGLITLTIIFTLKSTLTSFEKSLISIILFLSGYCFSLSIPTVIDRSLSFYILEKIDQRGGGIRRESFDYIFKNEYMNEHKLMDVRLTEQIESGTIVIINNCVRLTPRGQLLAKMSRYFRQNFLPKKRLLLNKYTDELTDPFRNSTANYDYGCTQ